MLLTEYARRPFLLRDRKLLCVRFKVLFVLDSVKDFIAIFLLISSSKVSFERLNVVTERERFVKYNPYTIWYVFVHLTCSFGW